MLRHEIRGSLRIAGKASAQRRVDKISTVHAWQMLARRRDKFIDTRTPDGTVATVRRTPQAARYATVDLGHDEDGRLVLTYERCASSANASCKFLRDDLDGRRSSFRGLAPANCELSTAPALWRGRAAYGLLCRKGRSANPARSGLYVKQRGHAPRQLSLKQRVVPFGVTNVTAVTRGTRVAALAAGGTAQVALTETVAGRGVRSFVAADSEGDTAQSDSGAQLGAGGTLWTLTDTEHLDDPLQSTIKRLTGACLDFDTLLSPAGAQPPSGFARAISPSTVAACTSSSRAPASSATRSPRPARARAREGYRTKPIVGA